MIAANADLDLEKARMLAARHGIPASYSDYPEMLEREKPDGVIVCVGADFHAKAAMELLPRGFHLFTEKPPAVDAAQARLVRETWQHTGRICMTGFKKRFAPAYAKAKAIIDDDRFGSPAVLNIGRTAGNFPNRGNFLSECLLESGIHVVDLAQWLFGRVRRVAAFRGAPANYAINFDFVNGAVGTLTLTDRLDYERGWEEVTAIGSTGVCVQVDNSVEMIAFEKKVPFAAHKPNFVAGSSHSSVEMGFVGELQAFVDAIADGTAPVSGIDSSAHTMEILEAVERSALLGEMMEIPE